MTNGAQALIRTLVDAGVDTCFTNPGTSEIHFVAALDSVPEMRAVLTLFEGVATGAADGYARMADAPGATLLHLGPGLGNGVANLHNARRARVPVVNIVGDHATYHARYDPPLQSDIETIARNVSPGCARRDADDSPATRSRRSPPPPDLPVRWRRSSCPADVSWQEGAQPARAGQPAFAAAGPRRHRRGRREGAPWGRPDRLLLGGKALRGRGLTPQGASLPLPGQSCSPSGRAARLERGAGLPPVERLAYWPELASRQLDGLEHLILVDAQPPVAWFAYPGAKSSLVPAGCEVHELSPPTSECSQSRGAG